MLLGTALEAMLQGAFAGVSLFGLVGLLLGPPDDRVPPDKGALEERRHSHPLRGAAAPLLELVRASSP